MKTSAIFQAFSNGDKVEQASARKDLDCYKKLEKAFLKDTRVFLTSFFDLLKKETDQRTMSESEFNYLLKTCGKLLGKHLNNEEQKKFMEKLIDCFPSLFLKITGDIPSSASNMPIKHLEQAVKSINGFDITLIDSDDFCFSEIFFSKKRVNPFLTFSSQFHQLLNLYSQFGKFREDHPNKNILSTVKKSMVFEFNSVDCRKGNFIPRLLNYIAEYQPEEFKDFYLLMIEQFGYTPDTYSGSDIISPDYILAEYHPEIFLKTTPYILKKDPFWMSRTNRWERTSLNVIIDKNMELFLKYLPFFKEHNIEIFDRKFWRRMPFHTIARGGIECLDRHLDELVEDYKLNPLEINGFGETILHCVLMSEKITTEEQAEVFERVVKRLINKYNFNISSKNSLGETILTTFMLTHFFEPDTFDRVVSFLIEEHKLNPNEEDLQKENFLEKFLVPKSSWFDENSSLSSAFFAIIPCLVKHKTDFSKLINKTGRFKKIKQEIFEEYMKNIRVFVDEEFKEPLFKELTELKELIPSLSLNQSSFNESVFLRASLRVKSLKDRLIQAGLDKLLEKEIEEYDRVSNNVAGFLSFDKNNKESVGIEDSMIL